MGDGLAGAVWLYDARGGGLVAIGVWAEMMLPGGFEAADKDQRLMVAVGLVGLSGIITTVLGLAAGLVAVFERKRRKTFAVAGLALNVLVIAGVLLLVFVASLAGS
jgi:hypothetical protein